MLSRSMNPGFATGYCNDHATPLWQAQPVDSKRFTGLEQVSGVMRSYQAADMRLNLRLLTER